MPTERVMADISQLMRERQFEEIEEANTLLAAFRQAGVAPEADRLLAAALRRIPQRP